MSSFFGADSIDNFFIFVVKFAICFLSLFELTLEVLA